MALKTTGEIREFVAKAMSDLRSGKLEPTDAGLIIKLSGRITESLYAEAKIQKLMVETGQDVTQLGSQPIGDNKGTS